MHLNIWMLARQLAHKPCLFHSILSAAFRGRWKDSCFWNHLKSSTFSTRTIIQYANVAGQPTQLEPGMCMGKYHLFKVYFGSSTCKQPFVAGCIHRKQQQTVLIQRILEHHFLVGWITFGIVILLHCYISCREISLLCCITVIVLHCQQNGPLVSWTDSRSEVISQSAWRQTLQASHKRRLP